VVQQGITCTNSCPVEKKYIKNTHKLVQIKTYKTTEYIEFVSLRSALLALSHFSIHVIASRHKNKLLITYDNKRRKIIIYRYRNPYCSYTDSCKLSVYDSCISDSCISAWAMIYFRVKRLLPQTDRASAFVVDPAKLSPTFSLSCKIRLLFLALRARMAEVPKMGAGRYGSAPWNRGRGKPLEIQYTPPHVLARQISSLQVEPIR